MPSTVAAIASEGTLPHKADVVVIGGGIMGVSAAYYLARKGHSVALVEKGQIGAEQSSRNWGWCRLTGRSVPELEIARLSLSQWSSLAGETGRNLGFRRTGLLVVTDDPAELAGWERWEQIARERQLDGRVLSSGEVAKLLPQAGKTWLGGLYSPTDGCAEPFLAAPAIAEAARALGATLHQNVAARGLETEAGRVSGVVTEAGLIRTSAVLCAGGAWTSMFCRHHGISLPQAGVFASACRTERALEVTAGGVSAGQYAFLRRLDGGYTVAVAGGGRVELTPQGLRYGKQFLPLFLRRRRKLRLSVGRSFFRGPESAARWTLDAPSPFEAIRVLDPPADNRLIAAAMARFRADYPALAGLKVAQSWGGFIDSIPDARPVISAVEKLPGFFLATGGSGHGFGMGPGCGRLAADLVAGDNPEIDPTPFRFSRFSDGTRLRPSLWD
ncbi:MAG TPA: FAD-binding oxidoreductase [Rhodopila sp.]|uniref:NAD(P)/FAD-dependent oxidoreductase n=1 Tax=Rhodopila sp. TaxID=2480087 RepID=UPI002B663DAD|nr:FAD-binding oxidoreductase [Rhodopila sp.]HVY16727.1 FAD-binding oxidoreductase [Rhodopila sp.]